MSKQRNFIKAVAGAGTTLILTLLSTDGNTRVVEVPNNLGTPRQLLGAAIQLAFTPGETYNASEYALEPGIRAYFPPEELGFTSTEQENLDHITNVHEVLVDQAQMLPEPFSAAGIRLSNGRIVGFEPGSDLTPILAQQALWTLGTESETQAIAELVPQHYWIEAIVEDEQGRVDIRLWNGSERYTCSTPDVETLRGIFKCPQVTADLIGMPVQINDGVAEPINYDRRGVPAPEFSIRTLALNPTTLWQFMKVTDEGTHVVHKNTRWSLKTPVSPEATGIVVSPADLDLDSMEVLNGG